MELPHIVYIVIYNINSCLSLLLWIGTTLAFFHSLGNTTFSLQDLNFIWRGLQINALHTLIMVMLIVSWPWYLLVSRFWIIFTMSFSLKVNDKIRFFILFENVEGNSVDFFLTEHWSAKKKLKSPASSLRILTEKNYPQIKFQRLRKIGIWTFGSLVHQSNSL